MSLAEEAWSLGIRPERAGGGAGNSRAGATAWEEIPAMSRVGSEMQAEGIPLRSKVEF